MIENLLREQAAILKRLEVLETRDVVPVVARYSTNAQQSIANNTLTVVNFEDVTFDPWAAVTIGAAWVFTAPVAGYYHVTARVLFAANAGWINTEDCVLSLYLNGALFSHLDFLDNFEANTGASVGGSDIIHLAKGDAINIRVLQVSGGAVALNAAAEYSHVAIERVKG